MQEADTIGKEGVGEGKRGPPVLAGETSEDRDRDAGNKIVTTPMIRERRCSRILLFVPP